jgi:hypothetical protein
MPVKANAVANVMNTNNTQNPGFKRCRKAAEYLKDQIIIIPVIVVLHTNQAVLFSRKNEPIINIKLAKSQANE